MHEWNCRAVLFDLDGTLVDSAGVIDRHTRLWATRNGLDPDDVLHRSHGLRDTELVSLFVPEAVAEREVQWLHEISLKDVRGLTVIAGATEFVASIPAGRWAVVTSGAETVARARMRACGLPDPGLLIAAEHVQRGKPAPDGYLQAAAHLGVPPADCLAFEDSAVGAAAARAAGMQVVLVRSPRQPATAHPVVDDFRELHPVTRSGDQKHLRVVLREREELASPRSR